MTRALTLTVLLLIIAKAAYEVWYADNGARLSRTAYVLLSQQR